MSKDNDSFWAMVLPAIKSNTLYISPVPVAVRERKDGWGVPTRDIIYAGNEFRWGYKTKNNRYRTSNIIRENNIDKEIDYADDSRV